MRWGKVTPFLFVAVLAAATTAAQSQVTSEQRRDQWFTSAKIGMMLHWGLGTWPGYLTPDDFDAATARPVWTANVPALLLHWERKTYGGYRTDADFDTAVAKGGWSADKWVNEAKKVHAKYITVASFHTRLGYLRPWRSEIPGSPMTKRDYIGELTAAAHKEDIKVIIYITAITRGDVEGYLRYARSRNPGLTEEQIRSTFTISPISPPVANGTRFGSGAYTFDLVEELIKKSGVDGIWFDSWNNPTWYPVDQYPWAQGEKPVFGDTSGIKFDAPTFKNQYFYKRDIVKFVHDLNPNALTFVNDFPPIIPADVISGEIWTKEDNYKLCETSGVTRRQEILLIPAGYWWYNGTCEPANKPAQLRKFVHVVGSGVAAALSEGPYVNGDLPPPLAEYNDFLHDFLEWAGESLLAPVVAGGHGQGGFPAGAWDDGAYGVTTMLPDAGTHYLHVLTPPPGHSLSLPDGGYLVSAVSDLKSGHALAFAQASGRLTINVPSWDVNKTVGDQVLKVSVKR